MKVTDNTIVSLRYVMKNSEGEELENTFNGAAVQYLHGSGKILPELENALFGLNEGDKKSININTPDIFHFDIEIADVRAATLKEIESGSPLNESDCGPGCCC